MNRGTRSADGNTFTKVVNINAAPSHVWQVLTTPQLMKQWMMPDIDIAIITDWRVGSPIMIYGTMNGKDFENQGTVLQCAPETLLQYSHLSSLSRLPDQPESYSIVEFSLQPVGNQTTLALTLSNFPTEAIYKHLAFYWNTAVEVVKKMIEDQWIADRMR